MKFKTLFYIFFILFLSTCILSSATIDNSLLTGGLKKYNSILRFIKKETVDKNEKKLQLALIYKLINISSFKKEKFTPFKNPVNAEEYIELFVSLIKLSEQEAEIKKNLLQTSNDVEIFREQILRENDNSSLLLTLQLQYVFYVKNKELYSYKKELIKKKIKSISDVLKESLQFIKFDKPKALKDLGSLLFDFKNFEIGIRNLQIEAERLKVLNMDKKFDTIISVIKTKKSKLKNISIKLLKNYFILFSVSLQKKSQNKAFKYEKNILDNVKKVNFPTTVFNNISILLKILEKKYLGQIETFVVSTKRGALYILKGFYNKITFPLFTINKTPITFLKLLIAFFILIFGFLSGKFYKQTIKKIAPKSKNLTDSTRTIISNLGYYTIVLMTFLVILNVLGINLSSIAIIAGALSFGVGFGLQNMVSNFVSGIILMFERSIKIGDYIELENNLTGHVTDIKMRATTITTNNNIDVIVPNQDLIQNKVINWTMNDRICRFEIPFGVKYGTVPEKVRDVILTAINNCGYTDIYFSKKPDVIMTEMGESSINFKLLIWIRGRNIFTPRITVSKYLMLIYNTLYKHNIEIPYPQNDLHIRSVDEKVSFKIVKDSETSVNTK